MNNNDLNNNQTNNYNMPNITPDNGFNSTNMNHISNSSNSSNNKTKIIIIGVAVLVALIVIVFLLKGNGKGGTVSTGSTEYKPSDVAFSCTYTTTNNNVTVTTYSDFIFNYKTKGTNGSQYTYQLKQYNKMVLEFKNTITDEKYKEFIDDLNSMDCLNAGSCTENHLELSISKYGWDTVVDRSDKKIEMTYYGIYGMGKTATKEDIDKTKADYEKSGYTCN